jgi:hypothetical protein
VFRGEVGEEVEGECLGELGHEVALGVDIWLGLVFFSYFGELGSAGSGKAPPKVSKKVPHTHLTAPQRDPSRANLVSPTEIFVSHVPVCQPA